jgi:hypothetical protein
MKEYSSDYAFMIGQFQFPSHLLFFFHLPRSFVETSVLLIAHSFRWISVVRAPRLLKKNRQATSWIGSIHPKDGDTAFPPHPQKGR